MIHGDLRATVTIMSNEFCPDLIGGCLYGRTLTPAYIDLPDDAIPRVEDPAPDVPLTDLLVAEVLSATTEDGVDGQRLYDRLTQGLPVIRGGRTVSPLHATR